MHTKHTKRAALSVVCFQSAPASDWSLGVQMSFTDTGKSESTGKEGAQQTLACIALTLLLCSQVGLVPSPFLVIFLATFKFGYRRFPSFYSDALQRHK